MKLNMQYLIQRGRGTGPMKPGNLMNNQGANSFGIYILKDEENVKTKPLLEEVFLMINYQL